jgi:hypothetical protein
LMELKMDEGEYGWKDDEDGYGWIWMKKEK